MRYTDSESADAHVRLLDRAKRLFQFLGSVQRLKGQSVYTVEAYRRTGSALWLSDLPSHHAVKSVYWDGDPAPDDPLLVIDRVPPIAAPRPPGLLTAWLAGSWEDPEHPPQLSDEIVETVDPRDIDDEAETTSQRVTLEQRPDIRDLFDEWLPAWHAWAAQELRDGPVRAAYSELFSAYVAVTGSPETQELVLGVGCLSWIPPSHPQVNRHLLTVPVGIRFDDDTGQLTVERAESVEAVNVELDMLDPALTASPRLAEVRADARRFEAHPLHRDEIGQIARRLVHILDAEGQYRDEDEPFTPSPTAVVAFAPAIILRRRSQRNLVKVFDTIVDQLTTAGEVPDGILPLINPDHRPQPVGEPTAGALVMVDDDPFLPLPVNDKQLQIIDQVDRKAQTLVQGPPGTGKTHTAAVLIAHLLAQGKRVLVTAQTDRALKEVREKLPVAIRPLAVGVVGTAREDKSDLKVAVARIADQAAEHDPKAARQEIDRCLESIDRLRRRRAMLHRRLVDLREQEVARHEHAGYEGTRAAIAQQLRAQADEYGWLDELKVVPARGTVPMRGMNILEWHGYLTDADLAADEAEASQHLPELEALPEPHVFADLIAAEQAATAANEQSAPIRAHQAFEAVNRLPAQQREQLQARLQRLAKTADDLARRREAWMNDALSDVRSGRAGIWHARARDLSYLVAAATPLVQQLGHLTEVVVHGDDLGSLVALAKALLGFTDKGGVIKTAPDGTPKTGAFTPKIIKQAQALFGQVRVNGLPPTTPGQLHAFITSADATKTLAALDRTWPETTPIPAEDTLHERLQWHVTELEQLQHVLELGNDLEAEQRRLDDLGLPRPEWTDLSAVRAYARLVEAAAAADRLAATAKSLHQVEEVVSRAARWTNAAPCVHRLQQAVSNRDHNAYAEAHGRLARLVEVRQIVVRREALGGRLHANLPALAKAIEQSRSDPAWHKRLTNFESAWAWAQAVAWLRDRETDDVNKLQARITETETKIRAEVEQLSATRAWNHAVAPDRITGFARANLTQYAQLVARLGKGTGKYADQRRAEIREALGRCRPAVPVWIMPIYRIAEQLAIQPNMFDVVIIDEASQAGLEATFLQYLAPKIVVIGDDKQVSPAAVGQDQQQLRHLAQRYLYDDTYRASWQDPLRSFFDEAKMRYGDMITLTEHRRCVPEIIGFSNKIAYEPDGIRLIPVRQYGADRLEPIKPVFVPDGYTQGSTNKVNPAEVDAVVAQIEACLADRRYDGLTFGVISLQGTAQAYAIEKKLLERIPPVEWAARDLRCGDSADFQGSERDVVFLSMVAASEPGQRLTALTRETYVQRYNVAASRAKDQMWVFHSVRLSDLPNQEDMRFALLDYCYGMVKQLNREIEAGPIKAVSDDERDDRFDSLFEQRVFNRLRSRGYTVIPQHPALSYRIDLVVVGGMSRLAIECDGDTWHGPEAYTRDLARQRDLERCGWRFHRIRESAYYTDQKAQLEALWAALRENAIHPSGWTPDAAAASSMHPSHGTAVIDQKDQVAGPVAAVESPVDRRPSATRASTIKSARPTPTKSAVSTDPTMPHRPQTDRSGLEPYRQFQDVFRPIADLTRQEMVKRLHAIVAVEGPMTGRRLHAAFVKAHGGTTATKRITSELNSAIYAAVRQRILIEDAPLGESGVQPRTYRISNQPQARPRTLGPRSFDDVPPLELAQVLAMVARELGWHNRERLYQAALEMLGLRRLTPDIRNRFAHVARLVQPSREPDEVRIPLPLKPVSVQSQATPPADSRRKVAPAAVREVATALGQPSRAHRNRLSAAARQRLASEAAWIEAWLKDNHEFAGADRYAVQMEKRELDETRKRLVERLDELHPLIREARTHSAYRPSDVVSPGMIVEIRYDDEPSSERVLVTCQRNLPDGTSPVSPFTALGQALSAARIGQTITYVHAGQERTVKVIAVHDS